MYKNSKIKNTQQNREKLCPFINYASIGDNKECLHKNRPYKVVLSSLNVDVFKLKSFITVHNSQTISNQSQT